MRYDYDNLGTPSRKEFPSGGRLFIDLGDHFSFELPDGRVFNVECTADDFSIVRGAGRAYAVNNGLVAYTCPVSSAAKALDGDTAPTTGVN